MAIARVTGIDLQERDWVDWLNTHLKYYKLGSHYLDEIDLGRGAKVAQDIRNLKKGIK